MPPQSGSLRARKRKKAFSAVPFSEFFDEQKLPEVVGDGAEARALARALAEQGFLGLLLPDAAQLEKVLRW